MCSFYDKLTSIAQFDGSFLPLITQQRLEQMYDNPILGQSSFKNIKKRNEIACARIVSRVKFFYKYTYDRYQYWVSLNILFGGQLQYVVLIYA